MAIAAKVKPRKRLPELPIYILAGGKLYLKKASILPANAKANVPMIMLLVNIAVKKNVSETIRLRPLANPSNISRRFKALVMPKTHKAVTNRLSQEGIITICVLMPKLMRTITPIICPMSLIRGGSSLISSIKPNIMINVEPISIPITLEFNGKLDNTAIINEK